MDISKPKQLRMFRGLTIQHFSDLAGVSDLTIKRFESGEGVLPCTVKLIADALAVEIHEIAMVGPGYSMTAIGAPKDKATKALCSSCDQWT